MKSKTKKAVKSAEKHLLEDNKDARKEIKEHLKLVKTLKSSTSSRRKK